MQASKACAFAQSDLGLDCLLIEWMIAAEYKNISTEKAMATLGEAQIWIFAVCI